jgi:small subunit ribosomal protein S8
MSLSDPIADMLTRIRNAVRVEMKEVMIRRSKVCVGIADALLREGFIADYQLIDDGNQGFVRIELKYGPRGEAIITAIDRASRPGLRVYRSAKDLQSVNEVLGIGIVSTSNGILSDRQCREKNVGGELLATVS